MRRGKVRVLRYEWPAPGDLVHLDIKRLGRIPEDGGWRNLGRRLANRVKRHAGYEYCHVAVDDHSRLPTVAIHGDQRSESPFLALEQVSGRDLRAGVRIKQILTDNGSCYARLPRRVRAPGHRALADQAIHPAHQRQGRASSRRSRSAGPTRGLLERRARRRTSPIPRRGQSTPFADLGGHTPLCRFFGVNDLSGSQS